MKGTTKKKKKRKIVKKRPAPYTYETKLAAMAVVEAHEFNVSAAAKELGIHKTTLYNWKAELWEDYIEQKTVVNDTSLTVQAKKMIMFTKSHELVGKSTKLFEQAIDFFTTPEHFELLSNRDKITIVDVILPYVLEKRTTMGVKDASPVQQNNFFQTVYNQMRDGIGGEKVIEIQES